MDNETLKIITQLNNALKERKMFSYAPYDWQKEFHKLGSEFRERMLSAGNRTGKTYSAAHEVSFHATGLYPDDWEGYRCKEPPLIWASGISNESTRDIIQKELFGGNDDSYGTGAIPKSFLSKPDMRRSIVGGVYDSVKVTFHYNNDENKPANKKTLIQLKSYEQGWQKFQGTAPNIIWLDEEPDDYKIFTECRTRLITTKGILLITFTPLNGRTPLVEHFAENDGKTTVMLNVGWDKCPHIDPKDAEEWLKGYPEWERDARSKGIPMLGEGRVFPLDQKTIECPAFEIPSHWAQIVGIDFGVDHPAATAKIAWDRDSDIIYVTAAHKERNMNALQHSQHIKGMGGDFLPVSWPHDGVNKDKGNAKPLYENYIEHGCALLGRSARYDNKVGGGQPVEPVVMEVHERMVTGRFKVFSHLSQWFDEFNSFHRKDGKIVAKKDDLLKATFYAIMMKRFAVTAKKTTRKAPNAPILTSEI